MINNTIHVDDETRFAFDLFDELFHKFLMTVLFKINRKGRKELQRSQSAAVK